MKNAGLISQSEVARLLRVTPAAIAYRGKLRLGLTRKRRGRFVMYSIDEVTALARDWDSRVPRRGRPRDVLEHLLAGEVL